jgi:hypothetical protein
MKIKCRNTRFSETRGVATCFTKNLSITIVYGDLTTTIVVDVDIDCCDQEACLEAGLLFQKMTEGEVGPLGQTEEKTILLKILDGERHFTI